MGDTCKFRVILNGHEFKPGDAFPGDGREVDAETLADMRTDGLLATDGGAALDEADAKTEADAAAKAEANAKAKAEGDAKAKAQADAKEPADVVAAIREVIPTLTADDFNKSGEQAPKVKAVEALLKDRFTAEDITADLVGQAWAEHRAATGA